MAEKQSAPRRNTTTSTGSRSVKERQAPPRRNDVIRCEKCGEDYATSYKRCPFCDERPGRGGSGRRVANNTRGGGYGGPVNPIQIVGLVISMILIIAALFIVFTKLGPLLFKDKGSSSASSSTSQSASVSSSASASASQSGASSSSGDVSVAPFVQVQAISLNRQDFTLAPNETYQIIAAVSPTDVTEPIVWTSSNASIATVDDAGNVTNVNTSSSKETVTITASCGGIQAECVVRCNGSGTASTGGQTSSGGSTGGSATPNSTGTIVNAGSGLNVRSGPGSSYEKIASIQNGNKVTILENAGSGWYKIDYGNGKIGYVSSDYVSVG